MAYTTISIDEKIRKELLLVKVENDIKTWDEFFIKLLETYKEAKNEEQ